MSTETIITGAPAGETSAADSSFWKNNLRDYGLLVSLLLIMAFFEVVTGGVLFRGVNVTNLILQNSYIVIMALGMLLVIVGGNIDLSVGSIVGFVGGCAAILMVGFHLPWVDVDVKLPWQLVIVLALILGGAIGVFQGYFIAYSKIPSFIVTLAGMLIFRGLTGDAAGPVRRAFRQGLPSHQRRVYPGLQRLRLPQGPGWRAAVSLAVDGGRSHRRRRADLQNTWSRHQATTKN